MDGVSNGYYIIAHDSLDKINMSTIYEFKERVRLMNLKPYSKEKY